MPTSTRAATASPAPPARVRRTAAEQAQRSQSSKNGPSAGGPRSCECGCDKTTRGGRFFPGHDAILKARLIRLAIEGQNAKERGLAEKRLAQLDWTGALEKSREVRARRAEQQAARASQPAGQRSPAQVAATQRMKEAGAQKRGATAASDPVETDEEEDVPMADEVIPGDEYDEGEGDEEGDEEDDEGE
jgi:hypothetical protein